MQSSRHDCGGVFGHFMAKYEILLIDDNCFPLFFLAFTSGHLGAVRTQYPIQYNKEEREIPFPLFKMTSSYCPISPTFIPMYFSRLNHLG
jgi:hypothetical protein